MKEYCHIIKINSLFLILFVLYNFLLFHIILCILQKSPVTYLLFAFTISLILHILYILKLLLYIYNIKVIIFNLKEVLFS
jgi:hypothetical protein